MDKFIILYSVSNAKYKVIKDLGVWTKIGPLEGSFGTSREGDNCLNGRNVWKHNYWRLFCLLSGIRICLICVVGKGRRKLDILFNQDIEP